MSRSNNDLGLLHVPKVSSLTFQRTLATGKIGFPRFSDGSPIMNPRRQGGGMHRREGSGDRKGTILKIFFSVFAIKHQGERQRRRGECSLPVEALTEDESLLGIKEAPSLIMPWWDASRLLRHSGSMGRHALERIQSEGPDTVKCLRKNLKYSALLAVKISTVALRECTPTPRPSNPSFIWDACLKCH